MIDEEQVKNIVKKVLDEEHLTDFIKIFEKEHNLFRGSHDKITLPENIVISEKIITQVIQAGLLRELADVEISSPMEGNSLQYDASDKKWKNASGNGGETIFLDNFADDSIFWGWQPWKGDYDGTKKYIQEIGGKMRLAVDAGYRAYWDNNYVEAPKVFMGILTYPCEIITRLDETTTPINNETLAGLFISKSPTGYGSKVHYSIGRGRKDSVSFNGLAVTENSYIIKASNAITTLPVWLRMRIGADSYKATHVYFDYSLDGVDWINMWELASDNIQSFSLSPASVGLYVVNGINSTDGGTKNAIYGKFDFFQMKLASIN
ncbi:hypothetical protein ES705_49252 [subsurface metagenome]